MKLFLNSLIAGSLLAASAAATAEVTVQFVKPETYRDVPFDPVERDHIMKDIVSHFVELARNLPAGTDLYIDVLDLDLAGHLVPARGASEDLRLLGNGADWPRMKLHYSVESGGKIIKSGDAQLKDMNYQMRGNGQSGTEPLRFEKLMIDDWYYKTIAPRTRS